MHVEVAHQQTELIFSSDPLHIYHHHHHQKWKHTGHSTTGCGLLSMQCMSSIHVHLSAHQEDNNYIMIMIIIMMAYQYINSYYIHTIMT